MLEWILAFGVAMLLISGGILLSVICIALFPWSLIGMALLTILTVIIKKYLD
jgi:cytochrome b subunit of formate dehydrogenase